MAYLADDIFEGLAAEDAAQFGTDLLDAVPVGVDLEPVQHLMAIRRLGRVRAGVEELPEADYIPAVLSAVGEVGGDVGGVGSGVGGVGVPWTTRSTP